MGIIIRIAIIVITWVLKAFLLGVRVGLKIIVGVWTLFQKAKEVVPIFVYGTAFFLIVEIIAVCLACAGKNESLLNLFCCGQYYVCKEAFVEGWEEADERDKSSVQETTKEELADTKTEGTQRKDPFEETLYIVGTILLYAFLMVPVCVICILIAFLLLPCLYALILQIVLLLPSIPFIIARKKRRIEEEEKAERLRFVEQMIRKNNGETIQTNVMPDGSLSAETRWVYPSGYQAGVHTSHSSMEIEQREYKPRHLREMSTNYQNMIQRIKAENKQYLETAYKVQQKVGNRVRLVNAIQRCEEAIGDLEETIEECQNVIWYSEQMDEVNEAYNDLKSEICKVKYADADLLGLMKSYCNAG